MRTVLLSIFLTLQMFCFAQKNKKLFFQETSVDTTIIKIDTLLIIGVGSTTTNIFLDDVSENLIKSLSHKGIFANYFFLAKTIEEAEKILDTLNKNTYRAILYFIPEDDAYFEIEANLNQKNINTQLGNFSIITPTSKIDYRQRFLFKLCPADDYKTSIWTAAVRVSADLRKSTTAKKVAENLLIHFKNNEYIK